LAPFLLEQRSLYDGTLHANQSSAQLRLALSGQFDHGEHLDVAETPAQGGPVRGGLTPRQVVRGTPGAPLLPREGVRIMTTELLALYLVLTALTALLQQLR
jgi:hypothetical protein